MRLITIDSVPALRAAAPAWDDLWERSDVALPTAQAELIALWIEQFAPAARVALLAVESDGQLVAALPLVGRRKMPLLHLAGLPECEWGGAPEVLIDWAADAERALDLIVAALPRLHVPLVWLESLPWRAPRWHALAAALERRQAAFSLRPLHAVARIEIDHDWAGYEERLPRNHRKNIRKGERGISQFGPLDTDWRREFSPDEVNGPVRTAFEIENRSWKGAAGTSVLRANMLDYLQRQARALAARGQLELVFLRSAEQPIAFAYGYRAKGTFFFFKIGYERRFVSHSPGHLLFHRQLALYFGHDEYDLVDCLGPLNEATARWATGAYSVGRLVIAGGSALSRAVVNGYRNCWPLVRRLRTRPQPPIKLGAASKPLVATP